VVARLRELGRDGRDRTVPHPHADVALVNDGPVTLLLEV
jgi:D-Tyr-tRNAtyr deacylase